MAKHCGTCDRDLPLSEFHWRNRERGWLQSMCKDCVRQYKRDHYAQPAARAKRYETNRAFAEKNPDSIWRRELWTRYRVTPEWYRAQLEAQDGCCAICGVRNTGKNLHIDHDHACCPGRSCGKCVRELLCRVCNPALGAFNDDEVLLQRAIDYVRRHRAIESGSQALPEPARRGGGALQVHSDRGGLELGEVGLHARSQDADQ